jgi:hypothetical protein
MDGLMIGRGMIALVAATLLLDGLAKLISPSLAPGLLMPLGFTPDGGPPISYWTLVAGALLLTRWAAPLGAVATTAMLGFTMAEHAGGALQLGCVILGVVMWAGVALVHPPVRALLPIGRERAD